LSDTITLIAGILLTSVGLLALTPYVLRLIRKSGGEVLQIDNSFLPALAAAGALMRPGPSVVAPSASLPASGVNEDAEELTAHLFGLRMTVSEITAEVQATHAELAGVSPDTTPTVEAEDAEALDDAAPVERAA
jgi:hypothetical protein